MTLSQANVDTGMQWSDPQSQFDADSMFLGDMLLDGPQQDDLDELLAGVAQSDADRLFARFLQGSGTPLPKLVECTTGQGENDEDLEQDDEEDGDEYVEEQGAQQDDRGSPTAEQVASWERQVVEQEKERTWKDHTEGVLQSRCFAVEWRASVLLDKKEFVRRLFHVVGGRASFVLGMETRTSRADYFVVVRMSSQFRKKGWRKVLMFGHGDHGDEEGLYMRVRVPEKRQTDDGINAFIRDMLLKCEAYGQTCRYRESGLIREQVRGESRSSSKRKRIV